MESEMYDYSQQYGSVKNELYDWVESVAFALVCMIIVFTFVGRRVIVDGQSMEPTLNHADTLISSRLLYKLKPRDIVIITLPGDRHRASKPLVKRVIATEGQTVDIDFFAGEVFIDGVLQNEPYIKELTNSKYDVDFPIVVPQGCVFVMGDNRNNSLDSRDTQVGMVEEEFILGKAVYRLTPFKNHGNPDDYWKKANNNNSE